MKLRQAVRIGNALKLFVDFKVRTPSGFHLPARNSRRTKMPLVRFPGDSDPGSVHAKEALHRAAQSISGATYDGKQWAMARCAKLDAGKLQAIVHALRPHAAASVEAAKCAVYIFHNRARMRYPKFHAQGLCTSTGVLEAGCKVAIGTRLKRSGMHRTVNGATPSSPCAAPNSADVLRTSGGVVPIRLPHDSIPQVLACAHSMERGTGFEPV